MLKIALAYDELPPGGPGDGPDDLGAEYESERTIQSLLDAIRACGHEALGLPFGEDLPARARQMRPDLVFNISEGVYGPARESIVPAWLDHLGIPYTGSDGLVLAVSLDKALTKSLAASSGVRTPSFLRVRGLEDLEEMHLEFPVFVKPNAEGSSMGIRGSSLAGTPAELEQQVRWVLETYRQDCLVEEFIPGREFCVGILGNGAPRLLPVVEIVSSRDFYPYEEKHEHRRELRCPADIAEGLGGEMIEMGLKVFRALGCRDLARVDFKLDRDGRPSFLEINPLPGLSPYYGIFMCQAEAAGLSHAELIGGIVDSALERTGGRRERVAT